MRVRIGSLNREVLLLGSRIAFGKCQARLWGFPWMAAFKSKDFGIQWGIAANGILQLSIDALPRCPVMMARTC